MKKILTSGLVSLISLTTFSFATTSFVHASKYVAGFPTFLKNKTWQSKYHDHYGKGGDGTPEKYKVTWKVNGNKLSIVSDSIYDGKHSSYKVNDTKPQYTKLSNNQYKLITHEKDTGKNTYTIKIISSNHIKVSQKYNGSLSYYAK